MRNTRRTGRSTLAYLQGALLLCIAGCTGSFGDAPSGPGVDGATPGAGGQVPGGGGATGTPGECVENTWTTAPLKRLTRQQYVNVLKGVVESWAPGVAPEVLAASPVTSALARFIEDERISPPIEKHGGFRRLDQAVQQEHVEASVTIATAVGAELTRSAERMTSLLGSCASSNDAACVRSFVERAGRRAHRRPLTAADVDFYMSVYDAQGIDAAAVADVIAVMLSGPHFFYQVEHGAAAASRAAGVHDLTGEELANRLALHFWNALPDATLLGMVDDGSIDTAEGYARAVSHVAASPRTADAFAEFFREWLSAEDLGEINRMAGSAGFDAMRGDFMPSAETRENMIDEVTRFSVHYARQPDGTFADLFTSRKSFATTPDLARIYGMSAPWSGSGEPPDMPQPERVGLLTHAALLATGALETRPIMKGVFIRGTLLCDEIPPAPANAMAVAQERGATLDVMMSTRERTDAVTGQGACAACHVSLINPLGFVTENFDSLGRLRSAQPIFDAEGRRLGETAVSTDVVPQIELGDMTAVSSVEELVPLLLESEKPQACFARKYLRFALGRLENLASDECSLARLRTRLNAGSPLGETLLEVANDPAFKQRRFD